MNVSFVGRISLTRPAIINRISRRSIPFGKFFRDRRVASFRSARLSSKRGAHYRSPFSGVNSFVQFFWNLFPPQP